MLKETKKQVKYLKEDVSRIEKFIDKEEWQEIQYVLEDIKDEIECMEDAFDEIESEIDAVKCSIEKMEG